ncbi:AraC family transcriptional regulator [Paraburkholderia oxyphila]|uniref:AraC family transcriptional regulator n=1 Tax=Paraburkholderia oxyphila TaxID=614212 RepID=UPI0005BD1BC4|nr:AraC family transcriptional regulator [Paraburkholderia oxyphila]
MLQSLNGAGSAAVRTSRIIHSHFDVRNEPVSRQLLSWRERVGHVIDIVASRVQTEQPFYGAIDLFVVDDIVITDCWTDELMLERTIARISRDNVRSFAFHVFLEGGVVPSARRQGELCREGILALDMDQPIRMHRQACRVITLFAPGALLQQFIADPAALHGRVLQRASPMVRLIVQHVTALAERMGSVAIDEARRSLTATAQLLTAAFAQEAGLAGDARAAVRAAMFDKVRRYVQANLQDSDLSPESVLDALGLPRPTLYRLFQHEGGIGAYIRHLRLRQAADDLVRHPHLPVTDIAYGHGFKSASDFTRAFRRAYDMTPQDIRAMDNRFLHEWKPHV